jgi:hypothetical protein
LSAVQMYFYQDNRRIAHNSIAFMKKMGVITMGIFKKTKTLERRYFMAKYINH